MTFAKNEAQKRSALLADLNEVLADLDSLRARLAEAEGKHAKVLASIKSERGTAQSELDKTVARYAELKGRLEKLLPPLVVKVTHDGQPKSCLREDSPWASE